jgi:hypothetical protein
VRVSVSKFWTERLILMYTIPLGPPPHHHLTFVFLTIDNTNMRTSQVRVTLSVLIQGDICVFWRTCDFYYRHLFLPCILTTWRPPEIHQLSITQGHLMNHYCTWNLVCRQIINKSIHIVLIISVFKIKNMSSVKIFYCWSNCQKETNVFQYEDVCLLGCCAV